MRPPRLARLLICVCAPPALRQAVLDDLDELLQRDLQERGDAPTRARVRYWREALRGAPHLVRLRMASSRVPGEARRTGGAFIRRWTEGLSGDIRYGLGSLWRVPTFALAATITLAFGVATTTTAFSAADAELWRPLPFPQPQRLVMAYGRGADGTVQPISGADLLEWRAGTAAFTALAGETNSSRRILQLDTAEAVRVTDVTPNFFDVLTRPVVAGRTFNRTDAGAAAILTDRAWRRLFNDDRSAVGRPVMLDEQALVIVGIVRADDSLGPDVDLFVALDERSAAFLDRTRAIFYGATGRLAPGVDARIATSHLEAVVIRGADGHADSRRLRTMHVEDLRAFYTGHNWRPLFFFLGASLIVLLLSAVNVASLLLGRAFRRTREFALRGALGGGTATLIRQLCVEGALLALPAGAVALLLTTWTLAALAPQLPADVLLRGREIPVDYRAATFAFAVTAATAVLFTLTPFVATRRVNLSGVLGAGHRAGRSAHEGRARVALLTAQLALTVLLLSAAGLFVKSLVALTRVDPGFEPAGRMAVRASLSGPRYASDAQVLRYAHDLLSRGRAVPGVRDAAVGSSAPLGSGPLVSFTAADATTPPREPSRAILRAVDPGFFRTLGIQLTRGRPFSDDDVAGAPRVAIVNEHLTRLTFGTDNPVGRTIDLAPGARAPWTRHPGTLRIVGVAANVKEVGLNEIAFPGIYVPFAQMPSPAIELIVRADVPEASIAAPLRHGAAGVDPAVPVTSVSTFDSRLAGVLQVDRFNVLVLSGFAAIAILLVSVGVYGAIAYAVQARTHELGVRLALGAPPRHLVGATLRQAASIGVVGGLGGLALTLASARAIGNALYLVPGSHNGLLYGVSTTEPAVLGSAVVGIVLVAVAAGAIPAHRVSRVDPVLALRRE